MDVFDEENSGRADIPGTQKWVKICIFSKGLPDSERGNKKGKKKSGAASKKTLTLQNFLQDENQVNLNFVYKINLYFYHDVQEPVQSESNEANNLEAQFAKLNLDQVNPWQIHILPWVQIQTLTIFDQEELIVMESCHSYIHDLLRWVLCFFLRTFHVFLFRQLGPTNAMDPILQQEINAFPPEAKVTPKLGSVWYLKYVFDLKWNLVGWPEICICCVLICIYG